MKLLRAFLLIPAAFVVIGVRLAGLFGVNIKFSNFLSSRIGHLVGNTEVYLCEVDAGLHSGFHIWTHYGPIANEQIAIMLKRLLRVWPTHLSALVILINKMFPGWEKNEIGTNTLDRDPKNLLEKYPPHLRFTREELERGERILRRWGIDPGAKFVCLMVRDSAYLPTLSYHSYRDCDIDTYRDAALMLVERGYTVFRMGAKVEKPFIKHPKIFDYATNGMRSDFMDVYLGAHCAFCVSTSTGWDAIPQAFKRPMCYTNFVPFEYMNTWLPRSLVIWKHHEKDGKRMSVAEIHSSGAGRFMRTDEFEQAGITLRDNTPEEIIKVVREMADMIEGKCAPDEQYEFWHHFPRLFEPVTGQPLHGDVRTSIGSAFLQDYTEEPCLKVAASSA